MSTEVERNLERDADFNYEDYQLKNVVREDKWISITVDGSYGFSVYIPWPLESPQPVIGDTVRLWNGGLGSRTKGISLWKDNDWVHIWYETAEEQKIAHEKWVENYHIRLHEEFEQNKDKLDAEYEKLPTPLKNRLDRFRAEDPDFRWKEEFYEMASIAEAARLYKLSLDPEFGRALKEAKVKAPTEKAKKKSSWDYTEKDGTLDWEDTPENRLLAFDAINSKLNKYNYKLQYKIHPEMDQGHSGNTWSHAIYFARILLRDGDNAKL
jgi:hypothetical protein